MGGRGGDREEKLGVDIFRAKAHFLLKAVLKGEYRF